MTTLAHRHFSTVEHIQKLRKANFTEQQAEVVAELIEQQSQTINEQQKELEGLKSKDLATKGDIGLVRSEIRESELRLRKEIKDLELKLTTEMHSIQVKLMVLYGGGFLILLGVLAKGFHWF